MTETPCKVCEAVWPRPDSLIIELGLTKVYLHEDQFFPGWTVIVFRRHATELYHLAPTERFQLMEEVSHVAKALADVFQAQKINYELLGNQVPHIHWHVIPRLATDPAPLDPVWRVTHEVVAGSDVQIQDRISRIRQAVGTKS